MQRTAPVKYGLRLGCRFGQPHSFRLIKDTKSFKVEQCTICHKREKWNKGYKSRIDNNNYLKAHVREYAQPHGSTKRVFMKLHRPESCLIKI